MTHGLFKGEIALNLALEKGLISPADADLVWIAMHKTVPAPGWNLEGFINAIGAGQDFLREVIEIQKHNKQGEGK